MVEPAVPQRMPGQGAIAELVRLGAGLESLVVPAVGKRPIPLQLVAFGVGGERVLDFRPRHVPVPVHVPLGHGVGDSLKAEDPHQPIEDHTGVMVFDCRNEAGFDCVMPEIVDASNLTGKVADSPDKGSGVLHSLTRPVTGRTGWHVRSTPPSGVGRRCRRRCTAGLSEWIGDRRESERRVTIRRLYERGAQRG